MANSSKTFSRKFRYQFNCKLEFRFFVISALFAVFYFIAGNIGSGWIYLLCSSMLVILVVGTAVPILILHTIKWERTCDPTATAGQTLDCWLTLSSNIGIWWLQVFGNAGGNPGASMPPYLVPYLGSKQSLRLPIGPLKRGVQQLQPVLLTTCFPLGIAWGRRLLNDNQSITVYPKVIPLDGYFLYKLPPSMGGSGGLARGSRSARQSTSTRGVREYIRGDSPRIIHWASSARTGKMLVREFEAEGLPKFDVQLDLTSRWTSPEQFDLAVTTAASLLVLGYRLGIAPQLIVQPASYVEQLDLPPMTPGLQADMEVLARLGPLSTIHGLRFVDGIDAHPGESGERSTVSITPASTGGQEITIDGKTLFGKEEDLLLL